MVAVQRNIPALRFPEFDGEWEFFNIENIAEVITGNKDTQNKIDKGVYPFFVRSDNIEKINTYTFDGEAILTSGDGVGVGKNFHYIVGKFDFHQRVYSIRHFTEKVSGKYFYYYFSTHFYCRVMRLSAKNSVDSVRRSMITKMLIPLGLLSEQQKIAEFLTAVDGKIGLLSKKKDLLERYKKGVMQKLFSQSLRFTDEAANPYPDWEEKTLGDIGRFQSGIGFPEREQGGKIGIPFYKVSDMNLILNKIKMCVSNNYVTDDQISRLKLRVFKDPAIIFAKVGAAIFLERKKKANNFLIDNNMMSFTPNFSLEYAYYVFHNLRLSKYAQVGALPSYNASDLKTLKINFPHSKEQQKIADFLSSIDQKITHISQQLTQAKAFKKGLLQQMFV